PRGRTHAHVIVRPGNDELVRLEVLVEDHLPGFRAFDPKVLRHLALQKGANLRPDDIGDPVHERAPGWTLEHDPEKWKPVFGKDHASTITLYRLAPRAAHAVRQPSHQVGHGSDGALGRPILPVEPAAYRLHQGGADHHPVGTLGNGACVLG